ncbi:LppX_LprAFG lipoprotein [Mycobacterium sp. ITM-2016-00318]|uniref:LppX_LprAFG lipoprotein n=1 Tax=Mycobacterium sp. ITM-2016-00318 TaxID=2099693 RepID=UPI000CF884CA|nr:LppX_LprAFG lipoprotein [Mycobacterium sp. ITM-2016-00318]WNG95136.1 LppX_LprAFG lipoprotein [Mycobacterium sp. ITM-2016-00318]
MQTRPKNAVRSLWLILTALFAATVLIAGCSSSDQKSSESLPDAATLLKESNTATRNLKSVHLDLSVQGTLEDLPIKTLAGDLTNVPAVAAQGNTKLTFQGSDVDANFVVADSILYVALSGDSYIDMGPAADVYDVAAILNPDTGLANVLANFSEPKSESTETINGVETVKVTGQVSADAVNKIAPPIKATGPVPGTAWIEKDGDHKLVQAKLEPSEGNSVQMTLSDWDKPVTVSKPAV